MAKEIKGIISAVANDSLIFMSCLMIYIWVDQSLLMDIQPDPDR